MDEGLYIGQQRCKKSSDGSRPVFLLVGKGLCGGGAGESVCERVHKKENGMQPDAASRLGSRI